MARKFRVTRVSPDVDKDLFYAWKFEYYNEVRTEWRKVNNINRKHELKNLAVLRNKAVIETYLV